MVFAKVHLHVYSFKFFRSKNNLKICCRPRFSISPSSYERATWILSLHERNLSLLSQDSNSGWEILRWQWLWKRFELRDMRFKWMKYFHQLNLFSVCSEMKWYLQRPCLWFFTKQRPNVTQTETGNEVSISSASIFYTRGIFKSNTLYTFTGKYYLMWKY